MDNANAQFRSVNLYRNSGRPLELQHDFKAYAMESLTDFYSFVKECVVNPDDQSFYLAIYDTSSLAPTRKFVADIIKPYPTEELYGIETYLSNIRTHYKTLPRNPNVDVQIKPDNIVIKHILKQDTAVELNVSYQVKLLVNNNLYYAGLSEASIIYPKINNKYAYKIQSVMPKAYLDYRASLHNMIDVNSIIRLAKESMRKGDYLTALTHYESLIDNGQTDFLFDLARLYINGFGVVRNFQKAYELLDSLYKTGSPRAISGRAYLMWNGINVKRDREGAFYYAQKAANQGDAVGHYLMGLYLISKNQATHADTIAAISHFESACKSYPSAYYNLALTSLDNNDFAAFSQYTDLGIEEGQPLCYQLKGIAYEYGIGVPTNISNAVYYYRTSAEKFQFYYGYCCIGNLYLDAGQIETGLDWYLTGFTKGDADCAKNLFNYYSEDLYPLVSIHGNEDSHKKDSIRTCRIKALTYLPTALETDDDGHIAYRGMEIYKFELSKPDYKMAFVYANKALNKGHKEVNYDLAEMYYEGQGVDKDITKAKSYLLAYIGLNNYKSKRFSDALFKLGYIEHISGNLQSALEYYMRSNRGNPSAVAYYNMGLIYKNPSNPDVYDRQSAIEAFTKSSNMNYDKAKEQLNQILGQAGGLTGNSGDSSNGSNFSSATIKLSYGTYIGKSTNGKPHGLGKLVYSKESVINSHDPKRRMAKPGEYVQGQFVNGEITIGQHFDASGNLIQTLHFGVAP